MVKNCERVQHDAMLFHAVELPYRLNSYRKVPSGNMNYGRSIAAVIISGWKLKCRARRAGEGAAGSSYARRCKGIENGLKKQMPGAECSGYSLKFCTYFSSGLLLR
ncbi:MAG: hypothetical protein ACM34A_08980 [Bacillota bacterium]